jgi:hypothetical protein
LHASQRRVGRVLEGRTNYAIKVRLAKKGRCKKVAGILRVQVFAVSQTRNIQSMVPGGALISEFPTDTIPVAPLLMHHKIALKPP